MRSAINRNILIDVLANRQDRIVVALIALRGVVLAQPFSGQLFQALAGYQRAIKRAVKSAGTGAARAAAVTAESVTASMRGLSRCWHTPRVMPHLVVVRVVS